MSVGPIGVILIGGIGLATAIWQQQRRRARAVARILDVAAENGWRVSPSQILATFDRCSVSIECHISDEQMFRTRLSARSSAPPWFSFTVRRRDSASIPSDARRVQLGSPFDEAFALESNDEELARAWFDRALRRAFGVTARNELEFVLSLSNGNVVAEIVDGDLRAPVLAAIARLVADAATGDRALRAQWTLLCRALNGQSQPSSSIPPAPILVTQPSCVVRVEIVRDAERWATRLTWTPVTADSQGEALRRDLPGIVLDDKTIGSAIEEGLRAIGGAERGPYR